MILSRRAYLKMSGFALSQLAGAAMPRAAEAPPPPLRARLSLNENPFGPSPMALAAIQGQFGELCRYADNTAGLLTQAIVARENVAAEQIVVGDILAPLGLHLALSGARGGEFIYSQPGYTGLVDAVAPGGGVVIGVPLNGELQNDLSAIAAKVNAQTRAIYLVNPHNPSGTVGDAATFLDFVREMSKSTVVIVDEAYLEFDVDFAQRTAAGLTRAGENVVVFRTFDKIYGLAGLPAGYIVAPKSLATSLRQAAGSTHQPHDRLTLVAAAASLRDESYVATIRAKVAAEREGWYQLFETLKLRYTDSRGNFVFFNGGRPQPEIAAALRAKGIDIGRAFAPLDQWTRISIGLPQENAMGRAALAELLG